MSSIDNRIVQMQFENSQFEKGVQQSLKTIDELNKKLEFKEAEKSMASLQKAGDSFSLAKMGNAVDSISDKFSALGIIGKRVLENLADTAYDKITSTVKALSVDQISAGWNKYADKTKAVQQIMAATHMDIESVNHELERLNWFSDETSYSFTDMVSNIGKFTSMNVPLDKSVTAMQGISTWAALSGAGVSEASRAMYNLSQAMGLGALRMQDWKSIALANMATSEFKQTAIDTATALGKLKKGQVTLENFESTLSKGWFDKDVMMSVFEQYGDFATQAYELAIKEGISAAEAMDRLSDGTKSLGERAFRAAQEAITFGQAIEATKDAVSSGWMNIFEQIFGNYEQAKVLWTDLANYMWDIFASPLSEIGDIFKLWNEGVDEEGHKILGNRADMLEGIYGIFKGIKSIIIAIRDAFHQIFPPINLENLQAASLAVKEFGDRFSTFFNAVEEYHSWTRKLTESELAARVVTKEFGGTLKVSKDVSDSVKDLQKDLKTVGLLGDSAVDGIFGPKTEAAVKRFQEISGLKPTGIFDKKTFEVLQSEIEKTAGVFSEPIKYGDRGEEVRQIQEKLIELGKLDEGQADGIWGPKTQAAVEAYQAAQKDLKKTGIIDKETFEKMFPKEELPDWIRESETFYSFSDALLKIQGIVKGVSAAFDIFLQVLGFVGRIIGHIITLAMPLVNAILSVGAAIGEAIASFDQWLKTSGKLDGALESIKGFFEPIGDWAKQAGEDIKKFFGLVEAPEDMMTFPKLWNNIKTSIKNTRIFDIVRRKFRLFRAQLRLLSPQLKASWQSFKESLGEKFNIIISGLPDKIGAVTEAIGSFLADGISLITSWLPTIPGAIDRITAFFNALTDPGDVATGRAPGFLYKVKQGFEDVIDFLFGKGDIENGKAPGILTKLWKIIVGDYAGAGLTEEQQAELIGKIEEVKTFLRRIGEAISFILTGELPKENALSEDAQKSIMEFRLNVIRLFEIIGLLVSGTPLGGEDTSLDSQTTSNILQFRDTVIGIFNTIGDFFSSIFDTINTFFSGEIDFSSIEGIRKTFEGVWNNIVGFFGSVGEGAGNAAKTAGSIAIGVIALPFIGISTIVSTVSSYVQAILSEDYSGFTDEVAKKLEGVRNWFDHTFKVIRALFAGSYKGLDAKTAGKIREFRATIKPIFEGIGNFFNNTWGFIQDIWTGITTGNWETENGQKIKSAFETVKSFFDQVGEGISILFTGEGNEDLLDPNTVSTLKKFNGYLTTIKDGVANFFDGAWGFAQDIWTGVTTGNWDSLKEKLINAFENVKKFFGNIGKIIRAFFTGKYDGLDNDTALAVVRAKFWIKDKLKVVGEFLASLPSIVKGWIDEALKSAGQIGDKVANAFSGISSFFTGVWGTISDVWTGIMTGDWSGFKDRIINAFENVKTFFAKIGKIIRAFFTGKYDGLDNDTALAVVRAKFWIKDKLKVVGDFFKNLPETFKGWGEDLQKNFGPLGNFFSKIFNAIGSVINFIIKHPILSLLIYGLFSLIRFIGSATGLIFKVSDALSNLRGSNQTFSQMIRSVAISFAIVAASIYVLGSVMDEKQLKQGMDAFIGIIRAIGIFVLAAAALSTTKLIPGPLKGITEKLSSVTKMIKDIGIGVALLTLSVFLLSKMVSTPDGFGSFLKGLGALFGIILELLIFFAGLAFINKKIGKIETVLDGLWQVAVLIGAMTLALAALTAMNSLAKPETVWVSIAQLATMFAMIAGLFLAVGYANKLAGIANVGDNTKPLLKGLGALTALISVMGIIVVAFAALEYVGVDVDAAIGKLAILFGLIAGLVFVIGLVKGLLSKFGAISKKTPDLGKKKSGIMSGLLKLAGAIGIIVLATGTLVWAIGGLDRISDGEVKATIERGGEVLASLSNALSPLSGHLELLVGIAGMLALGEIVSALQNKLNTNIVWGVIQLMLAIDIIVLDLVLLVGGLGKLDDIPGLNVLGSVQHGGEILSALNDALAPLKDNLGNLTLICGALAIGEIVGSIPGAGLNLVLGILALSAAIDILIGNLVLLIGGLGKLDAIPGLDVAGSVQRGGEILSALNTALSPITSVPENLALICGMLTVGEMIGLVGQGFALEAGVFHLSLAIDIIIIALGAMLTALGKLNEWTDGGLTEAINGGGEVLGSITGAITKALLAPAKELNSTISGFADALTAVATAMNGLSESDTLDEDLEAAKKLATDLTSFMTNLALQAPDGTALVEYKDKIDVILTDIGTLGTNIAAFRDGVNGIASSDITADTDSAIKVASDIATFLRRLQVQNASIETNKGAIEKWFSGDTVVNTILDSIGKMGTKIGEMRGGITGIGDVGSSFEADVTAAVGAISSVVNLIMKDLNPSTIGGDLPDYMNPDSAWVSNFDRAGEWLSLLGQKVADWSTAVGKTADFSSAESLTNILSNFKNIFAGVDYFKESETDFINKLDPSVVVVQIQDYVTAVKEAVNQAVLDMEQQSAAIDMLSETSKSVGTETAAAVNEGMASGADDSGAIQVALTALSGAQSYISQFNTVGVNYAAGLAQGMLDNASACGAAGTAIGRAAIEAAKAVGEVASPSKVMMQIGSFFGEGFLNGLQSYAPTISNAATSMFGGVITGAKDLFGGSSSSNLVDIIFGAFSKKDEQNTQNILSGLFNNVLGIDFSKPEETLKSFAAQAGYTDEELGWLTNGFFGLGNAASYASASLPAITKELKKGDWDDDQVKAMQQHLMDLGYDLSKFGADGKFGDETLAALTQFETDFGLEADGILSTIEAKQLELEAKKAGGGATVSFTGGETSGEDTAAASQAATDMIAAFKSHDSEFHGAGGYFTLGLAGGASKYLSTAVNAAAEVARAMLAKVREVFNSASPSKETAKYGMWFDQGLAVGVRDYANEATTSSEDVANAMLKTTSGTLSNLSAILAGDIDDTPTISPVVDLTNARAAAASIGGMFGAQSVPIYSRNLAYNASNPGVAFRFNTAGRSDSAGAYSSDSANLASSIDTLNSRMSSLEFAIKNMKVVTETGAIIGQIATGMDNKLGEFARMHERGG